MQFRRSGGAPTSAERAAVLAAGYTEAQVQSANEALKLLPPDPVIQRRSELHRRAIIAVAALSLGIYICLDVILEDGVPGLIAFGLVAVTIASVFLGRSR